MEIILGHAAHEVMDLREGGVGREGGREGGGREEGGREGGTEGGRGVGRTIRVWCGAVQPCHMLKGVQACCLGRASAAGSYTMQRLAQWCCNLPGP